MMKRVAKGIKWSFFGLSLIAILFLPTRLEKKLFATTRIIQTFEAGPVTSQKKKVGRVKTNFNWTKPGKPCPCNELQGPCIETFLDPNAPAQPVQKYPRKIESYYIQNSMGSEYQGAGQVPWGIDVASARIINIPFCGQVRRGKENKTTK